MIKVVMALAVSAIVLNIGAQEILFSTDFATKPAGIAALSQQADALGSNATVIAIPDTVIPNALDTVIDECKFGVPGSGSEIYLSKSSQKPVGYGDVGASNGRLHLKNSNCYIQLPSFPGPCTITYYAAGSNIANKSIKVYINDTEVPEAGFSDLSLDSLQAVRKKIYFATIDGPVVFKLEGKSGVYLYDIEVVSGGVGVFKSWSAKGIAQNSLHIFGTSILNGNNDQIQIFNAKGAKVLTSDKSTINIQSLVKGMYFIHRNTGNQQFTIVR